jgi:hypothetical protein
MLKKLEANSWGLEKFFRRALHADVESNGLLLPTLQETKT